MPERTGWRDQALSERHHKWGLDCPMVDIDFLAVEYDRLLARAIVEYKHERAKPQTWNMPSFQVLADLGNRAKLPAFAVRYKGDFSDWYIVPLNPTAEKLTRRTHMTEREWVMLLYELRGRPMPDGLLPDCPTARRTPDAALVPVQQPQPADPGNRSYKRCAKCRHIWGLCTCVSPTCNEALQISDCEPLRTDH